MFSHYSKPHQRFTYSLQNKYMSTRYFHLSSENQQTSLTLSWLLCLTCQVFALFHFNAAVMTNRWKHILYNQLNMTTIWRKTLCWKQSNCATTEISLNTVLSFQTLSSMMEFTGPIMFSPSEKSLLDNALEEWQSISPHEFN